MEWIAGEWIVNSIDAQATKPERFDSNRDITAFSPPLVDADTSMLLDPVHPNSPIETVHLVKIKSSKIELPITDGQRIRAGLQWTDYQRSKASKHGTRQALEPVGRRGEARPRP